MTQKAKSNWLGDRAASVLAAAGPLLLFLREPAPIFWSAWLLVLAVAGLTAWAAIVAPIPVFSVAVLLVLLVFSRPLRRLSFSAFERGADTLSAPRPGPTADTNLATLAVLGSDLVFEGRLQGAGETFNQGRFIGEILSDRVVVDADADMQGKIQGDRVEVFGRMSGQVRCDAIQVHPGGDLSARVTHRLITVAAGGVFEGVAISSSAKQRPIRSPKRLKAVSA